LKLRQLMNVFPILAVIFALYLAGHELQNYHLSDIYTSIMAYSSGTIVSALGFTLLGYLALASYDWLALQHLNKPLPASNVLLAGFIGFAVSNNAGHALLSGGSLRYRFYSSWGLGGIEIAQVVLFSTLTYFLAIGTLVTISYFFITTNSLIDNHLLGGVFPLLMWAVIILLAGYWLLVLSGKRSFFWRGHQISLPSVRITLLQTLIGVSDLLLAGAVLYSLLAHNAPMPLMVFINAYLLAQLAGLFSQVPGGLGVFEGAFIYLVHDQNNGTALMAALLVYRIIYYLLPLLIATVFLLMYELRQRRLTNTNTNTSKTITTEKKLWRLPVSILQQSIPQVLSLLLVLTGIILLISGNTPGESNRLARLAEFIDLPFIELSHLLGSIIGLLLLVLARAVRLKISSAYYATITFLLLGILTSLLKGLDYEEAIVLMLVLIVFLPCKNYFYRSSRLGADIISIEWIIQILCILILSLWIGFFAYRHVEYSNELWWQFAVDGNASRFLRAAFLLAILALAGLTFYLFNRHRYHAHPPTEGELANAEQLVKQSDNSDHFLSLTGDKFFMWDDNEKSFICYATTKKYWVAMSDPCGATDEHYALIRKFREQSDRFGAKTVFYRVTPKQLPLYIDMGMSLVKLGEEARINLATFSLKGAAKASMRNLHNKMQRENWHFSVIPANEVSLHINQLRAVSDEWLADKNTREKSFSLGKFSADYLAKCDIAIIQQDGKIVAFANLLKPNNRYEFSIDLMRFNKEAPKSCMEYLTICILLWGQEQQFEWFNLGMAPLSGLDKDHLAPLWHKFGSSLYTFGNELYGFKGLRAYKDKFDPVWEPRYMAVPSGLSLPSVLLSLNSLISGSIKGAIGK
jgi:phosphatidylglycerol lysyltransferase